VAAFGQTFDSNRWLLLARTQLTYSAQLVYPKIDAGARVSVGDQVWTNWWLTTWVFVAPPFFDQGRLIRSTWLCSPLHNFAHISPLLQRASSEAGSTVWNNWFFNTPYTAPNKPAMFAGRGTYHYAGGAAVIGAQRKLTLVLAGAAYAYQGATAHSDFGVDGEFIPYQSVGGDIFSPPPPPPPAGFVEMPDIIGMNLQEGLQALEDAGAVDLAALGYFGTFPVTVVWRQGKPADIITDQRPFATQFLAPNSPITLTVGEYVVAVAFP
jgi:hypothetical protein